MDVTAWRERFPITRHWCFLNHAAVAPMSGPAADAMRRYATRAAEATGLGAGFYAEADRVRRQAAALLHAEPQEITFVKNTTEGLGWVAGGLPWRDGDNVVTTAVEFPANVYPWMALESRGVSLRRVPEEDGRVPAEGLIQAVDDRTRVVTVSAVQYASGQRMDLEALGRFCRSRGVLLCVDAIQALGAVPVDVREMRIDFLSADGHKWLLGPEGCGIFYCRKELLAALEPVIAGWLSMKGALDFSRVRFEFVDSACRFDTGSYNLAGIFALGASIDLLLQIGLDAIAARVLRLTDRLVEGLIAKGYRVVSPRGPGEASGIVSFRSDRHDPQRLCQRLEQEHRVVISVRGDRLRASPHFYNTEQEIDRLVDLLPAH